MEIVFPTELYLLLRKDAEQKGSGSLPVDSVPVIPEERKAPAEHRGDAVPAWGHSVGLTWGMEDPSGTTVCTCCRTCSILGHKWRAAEAAAALPKPVACTIAAFSPHGAVPVCQAAVLCRECGEVLSPFPQLEVQGLQPWGKSTAQRGGGS